MDNYFYRYRPIDALLDKFHELDNQEIYFSATDKLNDPMEGFKDLVWSGDRIVWRNLLKHYALCVLHTSYYAFTSAERFDVNILRNFVFLTPQDLPEAPIREIYERVWTQFLEETAVVRFIDMMTSRTTTVRRSELTAYLRVLHVFALQIVMKEHRERGLLRPDTAGTDAPSQENLRRNAIAMMEGVTKITSSEYPLERISEAMFGATEATTAQVALISEYLFPDRDERLGIVFLTHRFPTAYVAALEKLVHRDWYVACFTKTAEDHSMWSTYADGHRGVCLMFKATPDAKGVPTLTVERITGAGVSNKDGPMTYSWSEVAHELVPVRYAEAYPTIDFFRSMGPVSTGSTDHFWFRSEDGSTSECRQAIYADQDAWRSDYWQTFGDSTVCKTREWTHEEEYRIVVHSLFDLRPQERRKLKYRFTDLAGIVFGARTDIEDKLKIMRIIDAKCTKTKRSDFKFFEIRYMHLQSRFQLCPLTLVEIKHS